MDWGASTVQCLDYRGEAILFIAFTYSNINQRNIVHRPAVPSGRAQRNKNKYTSGPSVEHACR